MSGSGKSTIANLIEKELYNLDILSTILDGDNLRLGLNSDLGFEPHDRMENVRRTAEVAKLFLDAGITVIVALVSPFRRDRELARSLFKEGDFCEVHVDVSIEEAERRDPKGLYKKARLNKIPNFTGIGSDYEKPISPEIMIDTSTHTAINAAKQIMSWLHQANSK